MSVFDFTFFLFAIPLLVGGFGTVTARNPVHAVLWMILSFLSGAGLMVLLGAEFVAMLLIIVYVGAVMVLFLFVVMMLDVDFDELRAGMARYLPLASLIGLVLLMQLAMAFGAWELGGGVALPRAAGDRPLVMQHRQLGDGHRRRHGVHRAHVRLQRGRRAQPPRHHPRHRRRVRRRAHRHVRLGGERRSRSAQHHRRP